MSQSQTERGAVSGMLELTIGSWRVTISRAPPAPAALAQMYDNVAWRWHAIVSLLGYARAYEKLFNKLENDGWLMRLREGAKTLDAGIGAATLSMAAAKAIPYSHEIHGVDISARMLACARNNLRRVRHAGLTAQLRYADANCLPYQDNYFDMVMSAHALEHVPNPAQVIKEMTRVLAVSAPLLIICARTNRTSALHGLRWRYRPIETQQLVRWMSEAGLRGVRRYALGEGLALPGLLSEAYVSYKAPVMPQVRGQR